MVQLTAAGAAVGYSGAMTPAHRALLWLCMGAMLGSAQQLQAQTLEDFVEAQAGPDRAEAWKRALRARFGGAALDHGGNRPEFDVARAVLQEALFMGAAPERGVEVAFDSWLAAMSSIPPPVAIRYASWKLQGLQSGLRVSDFAFHFADYYNDEMAPELVVWWRSQLADPKVDLQLKLEVQSALDQTLAKMGPLLIEYLQLRVEASSPQTKADLDRDIQAIFPGVVSDPKVFDGSVPPKLRLRRARAALGFERPRPPAERARPSSNPKPNSASHSRSPKPPTRTQGLESTLLDLIQPWLGTPYRWGGDRRGSGTDCSGFVRAIVYQWRGLLLPRVSRAQFQQGRNVSFDGLRTGDLVFFDTNGQGRINHVGIMVDSTRFAHASTSQGVILSRLEERYYRRSYRGARRLQAR